MLSSCFRFSSHRTCHVGFVSSTDALIGRQAGRFSESTAFIQRITCSLLQQTAGTNRQRLFKESPAVWSALSGSSRALNRLQCNVWVFGIAYLNIALFDMALRQFCMCCICGTSTVERQQPSGCSPTSRPSSPTSRPTCSLSTVIATDWQSMKSMTVSSMECVTQRQHTHLEHLGTA